MTISSRRLVASVVAASLLLAGGAPAVGKGVTYQGKTQQGSDVQFRATPGKVTGFKTSASVLCVSVVSGRSVGEIYPVLLQAPVKRTGKRFRIVFSGPSSTNITVKGKLKGTKAHGTMAVKYTKTLGMTSLGMLDVGACSAETSWAARAK